MIAITLNSEKRTFPAPPTVSDLLDKLNLHNRRVAVVINGDVINRENHAATVLADGDTVDIVHMVGGG